MKTGLITEDTTAVHEPVLERISRNIVESLKEMGVAMGDSGKLIVDRPNPSTPTQIENYRVLVVQDSPEEDEGPVTEGWKNWFQGYSIVCDVVNDADAATPIDTLLNRLRADIEKTLRKDPRRGGLAMDTIIRPPELHPVEENARVGRITVKCEVWYQHLKDDPYRTRGE